MKVKIKMKIKRGFGGSLLCFVKYTKNGVEILLGWMGF